MRNTLKNTKNGENAMAEDTLVQMLLEAADGAVADDRDVELARAAARWATEVAGWQLHLHNGFVFDRDALAYWVRHNVTEQVLEIRVRIDGVRPTYRTHARHHIAHLGHGLDVLASEHMIPARFCTLGRRALEDHAEVLERAAARLWAETAELPDADRASRLDRALGLVDAAESARRFAGAQLAVTG